MKKVCKPEKLFVNLVIVSSVFLSNVLAQITTTCEPTITGGVICETVDQNEMNSRLISEAKLKVQKEMAERKRIESLYPEWQRGNYSHQVGTPQGVNKMCYYRGSQKFYLLGKYEDEFYMFVKNDENCPRRAEISTIGNHKRKIN